MNALYSYGLDLKITLNDEKLKSGKINAKVMISK